MAGVVNDGFATSSGDVDFVFDFSGMQIGPYQLDGNLVLAPMAGVTDAAFRVYALSTEPLMPWVKWPLRVRICFTPK